MLNDYRDFSSGRQWNTIETLRMKLESIGNPHLLMPPTVHITGTNGKGSTLAFLKAILQAAGHKVHRYTSPHISHVLERIELSGLPIPEQYFNDLDSALEKMKDLECLTFFERLTFVGFKAFSQNTADFLLLETGMGGLFDATNVIEHPVCTAITTISFDHQSVLGETLEEIAFQKAGILKAAVPVVVGPQEERVMRVITQQALLKSCPLFRYGHEWEIEIHEEGFKLQVENGSFEFPHPSLLGRYQYDNAATAVMISYCLGWDFSRKLLAVQKGLKEALWVGRFQQLTPKVWVDGAHNEGGARAMALELKSWPEPRVLIWSMLLRKDPMQFLQAFDPQTTIIVTRSVRDSDEFWSSGVLASLSRQQGFHALEAQDLKEAIDQSYKNFPTSSILICGSLYLIQEALQFFNNIEDSHAYE